MMSLFLTLTVGVIFGYVFYKMKVPGGFMVGAIIGSATLNISFGASYMPAYAKYVAQITAGAFIGCLVEKSDIKRLKYQIKPIFILLIPMLILNIVMGFIIYYISPLDLLTSLISCVPGGMTDIPIISADMGADVSKVAILQFARMVTGIGLFPTLISIISRSGNEKSDIQESVMHKVTMKDIKPVGHRMTEFFQTIIIATTFGIVGKLLDIPAGTLLFSMLGVICFKLICIKAYMPMWAKRIAQILSGTYIGCSVNYNDVLQLKYLIIPALLLILGYFINCFLIGKLLSKNSNMSLKESMLAATPAGATDMVLISSDLGVQNTDVIVLQIARMILVVSIFPQIINIIVG